MKKLTLKELNRATVEDFKAQEKTPMVLVLDNIRSGLNVGSAFRTSDAFALEEIILCGITATPPHREILKTAIGATASMKWRKEEDTVTAIKALQAADYQVFAVEQAVDSIPLQEVNFSERSKVALVFGNEVNGVSDAAMQAVDGCIEVPQFGTKHSLNISVCAGVVVWEIFRQMKYKSTPL